MLQNNLIIGSKNKQFKPDFINDNILDLTTVESKESIQKNDNKKRYEISKNITQKDLENFFDKIIKETKDQ